MPTRQGVRYRYYVSRKLVEGKKKDADGWRLPANEVDSLVEHRLTQILHDRAQLSDWIQKYHPTASLSAALDRGVTLISRMKDDAIEARCELVRNLVRRVTLKPGSLTIEIDPSAVVATLLPEQAQPKLDQDDVTISIECPISLKRRGVEMRMVLTNSADQHRDPDTGLVQLILKAHRYLALFVDGQDRTLSNIAAANKIELSEVSRILPLAFLSPSIVDSILAGTQQVSLTPQRLSRLPDLPASWRQQSELLARA
jgi:site-specific DNA recombinase